MASVSRFEPRNCWRVSYTVFLPDRRRPRAKYARSKPEARSLCSRLDQLEAATRSGLAADRDIDFWLERGWLATEEALAAFPGYAETSERRRRVSPDPTDFARILAGYEQYALQKGKSKDPSRKAHKNHMSYAKQVVAWMRDTCPDLSQLDEATVREYHLALQARYASWTVFQYLTKLRLLLDQAMAMGMLHENPARGLRLRQPKPVQSRRVLTETEVQQLLGASLRHRHWISGGLPTVVRLGLYAGLRNEEMCWLKWDCLDLPNRIITIKQSVAEATGQTWVPKDHKLRRIDVKPACIDYLVEERDRQVATGLLGPFVLPGGGARRPGFRERPLSQDAAQKAFGKMAVAEGWDPRITIYCMRHTYATMALRSGVDVRTLQRRMGHSDLKTTMEYLHFIEPEQHPMDRLPY
ncbi:MAG: site-specific integrase [Candidatus Latescibacterota bacterium]|jgi:integrase